MIFFVIGCIILYHPYNSCYAKIFYRASNFQTLVNLLWNYGREHLSVIKTKHRNYCSVLQIVTFSVFETRRNKNRFIWIVTSLNLVYILYCWSQLYSNSETFWNDLLPGPNKLTCLLVRDEWKIKNKWIFNLLINIPFSSRVLFSGQMPNSEFEQ